MFPLYCSVYRVIQALAIQIIYQLRYKINLKKVVFKVTFISLCFFKNIKVKKKKTFESNTLDRSLQSDTETVQSSGCFHCRRHGHNNKHASEPVYESIQAWYKSLLFLINSKIAFLLYEIN